MKIKLSKILNQKYLFVTLYVCIALAAIVLIVMTFGFYPVAIVNYTHPVMAYRLNNGLDVALKFYGVNDATSTQEIKRAVLEGLIDEVSIDNELKKSMSSSDISQKINSQMNQILGDQAVTSSLSDKGISISDAKNYLLNSAIKDQLVISQLQLEGKNFSQWLVEQRKNLKVWILMSHTRWDGDQIMFD